MVCSVEGQRAIKTYKFLPFSNKVLYNHEFCKVMSYNAFRGAYFDYKDFSFYISELLKVTTCFESDTNDV